MPNPNRRAEESRSAPPHPGAVGVGIRHQVPSGPIRGKRCTSGHTPLKAARLKTGVNRPRKGEGSGFPLDTAATSASAKGGSPPGRHSQLVLGRPSSKPLLGDSHGPAPSAVAPWATQARARVGCPHVSVPDTAPSEHTGAEPHNDFPAWSKVVACWNFGAINRRGNERTEEETQSRLSS